MLFLFWNSNTADNTHVVIFRSTDVHLCVFFLFSASSFSFVRSPINPYVHMLNNVPYKVALEYGLYLPETNLQLLPKHWVKVACEPPKSRYTNQKSRWESTSGFPNILIFHVMWAESTVMV